MCAVGQAEVRRNSCWAFSWRLSNMHGQTYMQKPRMSMTYITCSCYGALGDRGPIFGWSNPHFTLYWKTTLLANNGWGLVLGSWKGRNRNHALLSWVIKPGTIKGVGSVWFLLWGPLLLCTSQPARVWTFHGWKLQILSKKVQKCFQILKIFFKHLIKGRFLTMMTFLGNKMGFISGANYKWDFPSNL